MISKVSRVRIAECPMPLPYVLRLGPVEIRTRDYIAIRIETESLLTRNNSCARIYGKTMWFKYMIICWRFYIKPSFWKTDFFGHI